MRELTRSPRLGVRLDMGPSRRATSEPYGQSGSKIRPAAREGYGPPPHVKPHAPGHALAQADNLTTAAATRRSCSHKNRCARNSGCSKQYRRWSVTA